MLVETVVGGVDFSRSSKKEEIREDRTKRPVNE